MTPSRFAAGNNILDGNPIERPPGRLAVVLRALAHRNYRLFFFGQSVSLLGTWMQQIAMSWLVFHLTQSAFMLGLVAFTADLPLLLFGPFGGVWADRWDRRRTLIVTQGLLMLQAVILGILALSGTIAVWHILILSALAGVVMALDGAMRSAFFPTIVEEKSDLGSAIALSSFVQNGAQMLGPPLAGVLIAVLAKEGGVVEGTGICFLLNGASYLAVCAALWVMHVAPVERKATDHQSVLRSLQEGLVYSFREPPIRDLIIVQTLVSLFGVPYSLMPVVAKDMLGGGADTLGLLMGSAGFGAVIGAIFLASRQGIRGMIGRIAGAGVVLGLVIIGFSFSYELWWSLAFRALIGFNMMVTVVTGFTLLQIIVAEDKRGRVISLYLLAAWGMTPLGSLILGTLADLLGPGPAFRISGICCLAGFLWLTTQLPVLRPLIEEGNEETEPRAPALSEGM